MPNLQSTSTVISDESLQAHNVLQVDDQLLRLVWHPSHFQDGKLKASAFDKGDLIPERHLDTGEYRYLSVDLEHQVSQPSVDYMIERQSADGRAERLQRHEGRFVRFVVGELNLATNTAGQQVFIVRPEPIEDDNSSGQPKNLAHCGVHRTSICEPGKEKQCVQELRVILLKLQRGVMTYNEVFATS